MQVCCAENLIFLRRITMSLDTCCLFLSDALVLYAHLLEKSKKKNNLIYIKLDGQKRPELPRPQSAISIAEQLSLHIAQFVDHIGAEKRFCNLKK